MTVLNVYLKPSQTRKGRKNFMLHHFSNPFLLLAAEKKDSKNGAARNFFGPSYFVTALISCNKAKLYRAIGKYYEMIKSSYI